MLKYYLCRFNRKSGKIDMTLEAGSSAMLKLWALKNTTKTKDTIIFSEAGEVVAYYEGRETFPKVEENNLGIIDNYCPGLLDAVREGVREGA